MVRTPCFDKDGKKKGSWSLEEDNKLKAYIHKYGIENWRQIPKYADLARCGKSCRLRWVNYLCPSVKRGNYTKKEEETIVKLHQKLGNQWAVIAKELPGRTDNEIKNYWHTHIKKKLMLPKQNHNSLGSMSHSKLPPIKTSFGSEKPTETIGTEKPIYHLSIFESSQHVKSIVSSSENVPSTSELFSFDSGIYAYHDTPFLDSFEEELIWSDVLHSCTLLFGCDYAYSKSSDCADSGGLNGLWGF